LEEFLTYSTTRTTAVSDDLPFAHLNSIPHDSHEAHLEQIPETEHRLSEVLEYVDELLEDGDDCVLACKLIEIDTQETSTDQFYLILVRHSDDEACIICLQTIESGSHSVEHVVPIRSQSNFSLKGDGTMAFDSISDDGSEQARFTYLKSWHLFDMIFPAAAALFL
jgi:hypothetical protein